MVETLTQSDLDAFDHLPGPVLLIDPADGRVRFANAAAAAWLGHEHGSGLDDAALADVVVAGAGDDSGTTGAGVWRLRHASGQTRMARAMWRRLRLGADDALLVTLVPDEAPAAQAADVPPDAPGASDGGAHIFRRAFEVCRGKVLIIAGDDHRIVAASDALVAATGAARADLIGRPVTDAFADGADPTDPTGLRQALRRVAVTRAAEAVMLGGEDASRATWIVAATPLAGPDGTVANLLLEAAVVPDSDIDAGAPQAGAGGGLIRAALNTFQEGAARRRMAESLLGLGIWDLDVESGRLAWSPKVHEIHGVPPGGLPPDFEGYVALVHPDDRAQMLATYEAFQARRSPNLEFRHRVRRADGSVVHVSGVGTRDVIGGREIVGGFVQDVTQYMQTRERLSQIEALMELADEKVQLGGWRAELDPERVIWTPQTRAIHEVPDDFVPTVESALDLYVPEDRTRIEAAFRACVQEGTDADEIARIVTANGRVKWVRAIASAVRDAGGRIVAAQGAFQDITQLMEARLDAEDANRRYRETLEEIGDAFVLLDHDWCVTYANSHAARLLARDTLTGRNFWDEIPEARGPVFEADFIRAGRTGETVRFETYFAPWGKWFDVAAHPVPDGLAVYFRDITEHKATEAEAREDRERFELIARAAHDVIWDWDIRTNRMWWNAAVETVLGYDRDQMLPEPSFWHTNIHPDDRERVLDAFNAVIEGSATSWKDEYRFRRADGSYATVLDRGFVLRDDTGRAVRMLGSLVDLTEQHDLERRLQQSQRLEAIGQLTGGVAHDFNNLLTVILGNAEMMMEPLTDRQQIRIMADMTAQAAERGAELTNRLLAFARRQALEPRRVDINGLLRGSETLLRRTISEDVEIEVIRAAGLWPAEIDPGQLEVALINLVLNASDALPGGGRITIETANTHISDDYAQTRDEVAAGQYVLVSVSDDGIGMDAETVAKAIDPFFTTKDIGKGSGLGLSMVYGFVKQSRGHLAIYSEPGEGTAIKLYFPRAGAMAKEQEVMMQDNDVPGGNEHVLIVEDDELVRANLGGQLRGLGYRVTEAGDGPSALALLDGLDDLDLLLTDIVMPGGLNGRELADRATHMRPGLRVLYTSGYTENAIVHQGRLDPGIDLLSKPYRRRDLARKVRAVLDRPR